MVHDIKVFNPKGELIKVINGYQVKQLETRSNKTYTLKSDKINFNNYNMLSLNKKDIDHYLSLVEFKTIKHWVKFYWSDRDISNNMAYNGILKFFNKDCTLPDYFFK